MIMLDFYTLQATIDALSTDKHTYSAADIATLCRAGKLTPVFPYSRYVMEYFEDTGHDITTIAPFNGYLTSSELLTLLDGYSDSISLDKATVYYDSDNTAKDYPVILLAKPLNYYRLQNDDSYSVYSDNDLITVTSEQLRFKSKDVNLLAEQSHASLPLSDIQASLMAENERLKKELEQVQSCPNEVKGYLATILDDTHPNHAPDLEHAINLWIDLYIHKKVGGSSHSGMADNWISKNTNYAKNPNSSTDRIREVATPLKDFGGQRTKEVGK